MGFDVSRLRKRLTDKRKNLRKAIAKAKDAGYTFENESQVLRASHIELINEILRIIDELQD